MAPRIRPVHKSKPKSKPTPTPTPTPTREPLPRTLLRTTAALVGLIGFTLFGIALAELTLTPSPASSTLAGSNLTPGHSISAYLRSLDPLEAAKQLGGNIALGIPFGVLLPLLAPRPLGFPRVLGLTVLVMGLIELVQGAVIQGRAFDIDDVILNTTGALLGYLLIGHRTNRLLRRRRQPTSHTNEGNRPVAE